MSDETRNMCQEHAESLKHRLAVLWMAHDADVKVSEEGTPHPGEACDECEDVTEGECGEHYDRDPLEYLAEMPLEIVWELGTPFAVVFGTGGPHVEIEWDQREARAGIAVYWGGETAKAWGDAVDRTAVYFREMVADQ